MAEVYDIALNKTTGDVLIVNGDFAISESTEQHMSDIIASEKGEYKAAPLVGVAIKNNLNDDVIYSDDLKRDIMEQLETDGMEIEEININSIENIEILAQYNENN